MYQKYIVMISYKLLIFHTANCTKKKPTMIDSQTS